MYKELRAINVKDKVERKGDLTYLSWAYAWDAFAQACPDARYTIAKNPQGLPVFESEAGAMVWTSVTAGGLTHEMWLPVMDQRNNAMKREPYQFQTKRGVVTVEAYTMMDINKTVMRCLVKNLAMFGIGIAIYAGEDLPDGELDESVSAIMRCTSERDLEVVYKTAMRDLLARNPDMRKLTAAKDQRLHDLQES